MKKITESEFNLMGWDDKWHHITSLQSEVERLEAMVGGKGRELTSEQKVDRLQHKRLLTTNMTLADTWASIARDLADGTSLDNLCTAAGISLTTTEEV